MADPAPAPPRPLPRPSDQGAPLPRPWLALAVALASLLVILAQVFQPDPHPGAPEQSTRTLTVSSPQSRAEVLVGRMDGAFAFELAVDPTLGTLIENVHGDIGAAAFRSSRPLTGWMAWALSLGGQRPLIAPALLVLTALSLGGCVWAIQYATGLQRAKYPAAAVLLPGMLVALISPGLTDQMAAGFAVAAVGAYRRENRAAAVGLLTAAVLSRETTLAVAGALTVVELWRTRKPQALLYALVPMGVFLAWNTVVRLVVGFWSFRASGGHAGAPGSGLIAGIEQWGQLEMVSMATFVMALALLVMSRDATLQWVAGLHVLLALTMTEMVWRVWWGFGRVLLPAQLLAFLYLVHETADDGSVEGSGVEAVRSAGTVSDT